ncbi:unnamed protein product [Microthlaspi erraticum]|uniref:Uncharacterized protein n=1 Tax=Microthlaspi erraticum TaxID=1685480 RepID=A0A6D2JZD5_9BRAS|nr:unnamed protein product [Microthlaspi erraticum]
MAGFECTCNAPPPSFLLTRYKNLHREIPSLSSQNLFVTHKNSTSSDVTHRQCLSSLTRLPLITIGSVYFTGSRSPTPCLSHVALSSSPRICRFNTVGYPFWVSNFSSVC